MFTEPRMDGEARRFTREINAHRTLVEAVQDVTGLTRVEHHVLAFLIEDMRRQAPDDFERLVSALIDELRAIKQLEGIPGLTKILSREFNRRYEAFVSNLKDQETDPVRKENMGILVGRLGKDLGILEQAYANKTRVPIGSVVLEHVPPWFEQT